MPDTNGTERQYCRRCCGSPKENKECRLQEATQGIISTYYSVSFADVQVVENIFGQNLFHNLFLIQC